MIIKIWFSQKEPLTFSLRKYKLYIFFKTQSRVFTPFSGRKRRIYAGNGVNTPATKLFRNIVVCEYHLDGLKNDLVWFCIVCYLNILCHELGFALYVITAQNL